MYGQQNAKINEWSTNRDGTACLNKKKTLKSFTRSFNLSNMMTCTKRYNLCKVSSISLGLWDETGVALYAVQTRGIERKLCLQNK